MKEVCIYQELSGDFVLQISVRAQRQNIPVFSHFFCRPTAGKPLWRHVEPGGITWFKRGINKNKRSLPDMLSGGTVNNYLLARLQAEDSPVKGLIRSCTGEVVESLFSYLDNMALDERRTFSSALLG